MNHLHQCRAPNRMCKHRPPMSCVTKQCFFQVFSVSVLARGAWSDSGRHLTATLIRDASSSARSAMAVTGKASGTTWCTWTAQAETDWPPGTPWQWTDLEIKTTHNKWRKLIEDDETDRNFKHLFNSFDFLWSKAEELDLVCIRHTKSLEHFAAWRKTKWENKEIMKKWVASELTGLDSWTLRYTQLVTRKLRANSAKQGLNKETSTIARSYSMKSIYEIWTLQCSNNFIECFSSYLGHLWLSQHGTVHALWWRHDSETFQNVSHFKLLFFAVCLGGTFWVKPLRARGTSCNARFVIRKRRSIEVLRALTQSQWPRWSRHDWTRSL